MNWADCAFTLYLENRIGTIKLLPHCHTLASFPGLPRFYLLFAFTIIHESGLPLLCIVVNANRSKKQGRPGNELYISKLFICALLFLYSLSPIYSRTDTCPLTTNVFDYASQNFSLVINDLWPTEKLNSLQIWLVELAGLEVAMKLCTFLL